MKTIGWIEDYQEVYEGRKIIVEEAGDVRVVELDNMKAKLLTYETPLAEVRDSL